MKNIKEKAVEENKEDKMNAKDWTFIGFCMLAILSFVFAISLPTDDRGVIVFWFCVPLAVLFIYFIPYFVALCKGHKQIFPIFLLNLFAGWTFIGWLIALIWASYNYNTTEIEKNENGKSAPANVLISNKIDMFLNIILLCIFLGGIIVVFVLKESDKTKESLNEDYSTYEVSGVKVTELYKYPRYDFSVVKVDKMPKTQNEIFSFIKELILYFPVKHYWAAQIYVYDYDVGVTSIKYASKNTPGDLSGEAEKLRPAMFINEYKDVPSKGDTAISACVYNSKRGKYEGYSFGFGDVGTDLYQWKYTPNPKACWTFY